MHNISRCSKLNTEALWKFKRPKLLIRVFSWSPLYIETHEMNNKSYREIQMVNTFHSLVQFWRIIYRDGRNWTRKLSANSNSHNFWLGCMCEAQDTSRCSKNKQQMLSSNLIGYNFSFRCPIQAHNISRRSKLNNRSSREIKMVITCHTEVQFRRIIYWEAWNWTTEALEKLKWS